MPKKKEKTTELPPIDKSKINPQEFATYVRDPVTGDLKGQTEATKPREKKQEKR